MLRNTVNSESSPLSSAIPTAVATLLSRPVGAEHAEATGYPRRCLGLVYPTPLGSRRRRSRCLRPKGAAINQPGASPLNTRPCAEKSPEGATQCSSCRAFGNTRSCFDSVSTRRRRFVIYGTPAGPPQRGPRPAETSGAGVRRLARESRAGPRQPYGGHRQVRPRRHRRRHDRRAHRRGRLRLVAGGRKHRVERQGHGRKHRHGDANLAGVAAAQSADPERDNTAKSASAAQSTPRARSIGWHAFGTPAEMNDKC